MGKVRRKNKIRRNLVLKALYDKGELSLTELCEETGITLPVLKKLISDLKRESLIVPCKIEKNGKTGRPPKKFKLNKDGGYIIGVDIGRLFTNFILLDLEQNIICEKRLQTFSLQEPDKFIQYIYDEVIGMVKTSKIPYKKLLGIGISIPGIVKSKEGRSETYLNFGEKTTREIFIEKFKKPVYIEHDAKAMALGELWMGSAKGCKNVLSLNIGWGIGLGIIIDGKLYYGESGFAGEFGHIQVVPGGELCYCGKYGCLETVASGKALTQLAREKIRQGVKTILTKDNNFNIENLDARDILEAANKGDQFSIDLIENSGRYIGLGIGYLINIFNPEKVILGGGITIANKYLINSIISSAMKYSLPHINKDVKFEISTLGVRAGAMGVAILAVKDLFEVEHLNPTAFI